MSRPKRVQLVSALGQMLAGAARPVYALDALRQIVFCNPSLAEWMDLEESQILGRYVEYHSEFEEAPTGGADVGGVLTGLAPPPEVLAGQVVRGTVSSVDRSGHLVHRRGHFFPLDVLLADDRAPDPVTKKKSGQGVLAILDGRDLTTGELAQTLGADASPDLLHRAIRQFRRSQASEYAIENLLGESPGMCKVRAQVDAAAQCNAHVLIVGRSGSGRDHIARAIHYWKGTQSGSTLLPLDCAVLSEDLLRRSLRSIRELTDKRQTTTVLLSDLGCLAPELQTRLVETIDSSDFTARIVATVADGASVACGGEGASLAVGSEYPVTESKPAHDGDPRLFDRISTITIRVPRLVERMDDLPLLAQFFLEAANRDSPRQVSGVSAPALDLLALYTWPGELEELREVLEAAHASCGGPTVLPADLPAVIHHAVQAASLSPRAAEPIVLDDFLAHIERELIGRALNQAGGNKAEAARLLGMTRPRLYRRMVHHGLAGREPTSDGEEKDAL